MSDLKTHRVVKVSPIERIFREIVGRKMTPEERRHFHVGAERVVRRHRSDHSAK